MNIKLDELIEACGDVRRAIENRSQCITRRAAEGKETPRASAELRELLALPFGYRTPKQAASDAAQAEYVRNTQGVD